MTTEKRAIRTDQAPTPTGPFNQAMRVGSHGMVSAGHSLAAAAALDVLQHAGNAVDAALTASAVQCVVEMPWCSLGGDAFMLVYTPADGVLAFNGSGAAPTGLHKS